MSYIRKVTPEMLPLQDSIADSVIAGEEVLLRVGRMGIQIDYVTNPKAEWRSFPPVAEAEPSSLVTRPEAAIFAAYEEQRLIGLCACICRENGWCELLDLRVDTPCRRKGIAGMMLDAVERFAQGRQMRGISVATSEDNPAFCQFCTSKGFTLQGFDRYALIYTAQQKLKPFSRRACALYFYRQFKEN